MDEILVDSVDFAYEGTPVLQGANLRVQRGQMVALVGPNGGGKTTLLRLMMGLLEPDRGTVRLTGRAPIEVGQRIGYVPQTLTFDRQFPITVLDLVLLGRLGRSRWYAPFSRRDRDKALAALDRVGLADYANRSFGALSGGETQRALIARALAGEAELLILDEPTAHLDLQTQSIVSDLIAQLHGSMTILMVTHDWNLAVNLADRIACVCGGIEEMAPQQLCQHEAFLNLYHRRGA
jgi:zinc transport system ATP-binding protein